MLTECIVENSPMNDVPEAVSRLHWFFRSFDSPNLDLTAYRQEVPEPPMNSKEPPMFYNRYAEEKLAGRGRHQPRSKSMPKYAKHFSDPQESSNADSPRPERAVNDEERRYRRKDRPGNVSQI